MKTELFNTEARMTNGANGRWYIKKTCGSKSWDLAEP